MRRTALYRLRCIAPGALLPSNYSNTPYKKAPTTTPRPPTRNESNAPGLTLQPVHTLRPQPVMPPPPPPMRSTFVDHTPSQQRHIVHHEVGSFRAAQCRSTDLAFRQPLWLQLTSSAHTSVMNRSAGCTPSSAQAISYGERIRQLSCRWAAKHYGNVTFGPRNYPYPSSRWLARRFQMKKHRIIKRFRFRRYKLAAVANLPFAKMIRVGMLPELKSSKTRKGDTVDADLSAQLVGVVRSSNAAKEHGKRSRPKSKYQTPQALLRLPYWHKLLLLQQSPRTTSQAQHSEADDVVYEIALLPTHVLCTMAQCWLHVAPYIDFAHIIDACMTEEHRTKAAGSVMKEDKALVHEVLTLWGAQVMLARLRDMSSATTTSSGSGSGGETEATLSIQQCVECIAQCLQKDISPVLVALTQTVIEPALQVWGVVRDVFFVLAYTFSPHHARLAAILTKVWRYAATQLEASVDKTRGDLQQSYLSHSVQESDADEECRTKYAAPLLQELHALQARLSARCVVAVPYVSDEIHGEDDEATAEVMNAQLSAIAQHSTPHA